MRTARSIVAAILYATAVPFHVVAFILVYAASRVDYYPTEFETTQDRIYGSQ